MISYLKNAVIAVISFIGLVLYVVLRMKESELKQLKKQRDKAIEELKDAEAVNEYRLQVDENVKKADSKFKFDPSVFDK